MKNFLILFSAVIIVSLTGCSTALINSVQEGDINKVNSLLDQGAAL
jgi:type III secretory pathway lipoprotein EscJ